MERIPGLQTSRPCLERLTQLPIEEVARCAAIDDSGHPEFMPSECVLHFVRQARTHGDAAPYRDLFVVLRNRILRAVPAHARTVAGSAKTGVRASDSDIQDFVLDRFQVMLCSDRREYDDRLDFYEVRFNSAIAKLRLDARRKVERYEARHEQVVYDGDGATPSQKVEEALARLRDQDGKKEDDFLYRLKFHAGD